MGLRLDEALNMLADDLRAAGLGDAVRELPLAP